MNRISRTDVVDAEFVDAIELASDGYTDPYRTVSIVSTTNVSGDVVISTPTVIDRLDNIDEPVQVGDIFEILAGTAAGVYTVAAIIDPDNTFSVLEPIADSVGGSGNLYHPSGATKVGVDPRNINNSDSTVLQQVLEDLDSAIDGYGAGTLPDATCCGQILYSVDGLTFQRALPITSKVGWLVNRSGIHIVNVDEE
jgi:hypothetical protein